MKNSERIKRMKKYLKSPCPACGDPINVCNENPDTNHYELVVNDEGKVIGESERMFKGKKKGGVETEAEGRNTKPNLKLKKEEKKICLIYQNLNLMSLIRITQLINA